MELIPGFDTAQMEYERKLPEQLPWKIPEQLPWKLPAELADELEEDDDDY